MTKNTGPEQRQFGRRQTNLHAWISVPGRPRLPCTVKNLSIGGALLELDAPAWLPYNFQLTIEATRFVTMCEVRHNSATAIGVRFMAAVEYAVVDRQRASDNRSLQDSDAWMGDAESAIAPATRTASDPHGIARAFRGRH